MYLRRKCAHILVVGEWGQTSQTCITIKDAPLLFLITPSFLHSGFSSRAVTYYKVTEGTFSLYMDSRLSPLTVGSTVLDSWHLYLVTGLLSMTEARWQLMKDCGGHWFQGTQVANCLQHGQTGDPGRFSRLCVLSPGKR